MVDPLDAPLMGSTMIHGPEAKIRRCSAGTDSERHLDLMIPVDLDLIWV